MEPINFGALFTFVMVTTFTPGPNNISSSSMSIVYGYRKTIRFLLGIATGFFGVMLLTGIISGTLYTIFPALEPVMRLIGAAYILWLAYKTFQSSHSLSASESPALGFTNGLLLQALNLKVWVYGLTLYTTFLAAITDQTLLLILSAVALAFVSFCSISTWALSSMVISRILHQPRLQRAINAVLTLLLVYTAIELSGIL